MQGTRTLWHVGSVIFSICAIALVIGVGAVAHRVGLIDDAKVKFLSDITYWITAPAMLFHAIANADVLSAFGSHLGVAAVAGVSSALAFVIIGGGLMRVRGGDLVMGAMSSSLNNAAYIGIPIAVYVFGETTHVVPILIFQLGFFTPMFFVMADIAGSGKKPKFSSVIAMVVKNPMVIAAAIGFVLSLLPFDLPTLLEVSTSVLGDGAPPVILLAFGASLLGQRGSHAHLVSGATIVASISKLFVQPLVACGIGYLLGLSSYELMVVTVMAGLPTAQNAFIAASRARTGEGIAQGTVLITTLASLPLSIATAWIFHSLLGV